MKFSEVVLRNGMCVQFQTPQKIFCVMGGVLHRSFAAPLNPRIVDGVTALQTLGKMGISKNVILAKIDVFGP